MDAVFDSCNLLTPYGLVADYGNQRTKDTNKRFFFWKEREGNKRTKHKQQNDFPYQQPDKKCFQYSFLHTTQLKSGETKEEFELCNSRDTRNELHEPNQQSCIYFHEI